MVPSLPIILPGTISLIDVFQTRQCSAFPILNAEESLSKDERPTCAPLLRSTARVG